VDLASTMGSQPSNVDSLGATKDALVSTQTSNPRQKPGVFDYSTHPLFEPATQSRSSLSMPISRRSGRNSV
jgi:hypothetical protein